MARQPSRFSTSRNSTTARSTASAPASKVPVSLPKRLLFPQLPAGSELPPLIVCDDRELNAELYEFLAFALRGFVSPWWSKLTRYDKEFLPEITRIIAIFLRELEARLAHADLPTLMFRDVPNIVSQHYVDYRNAAAKVGTSYAIGGSATLSQIFHQMQPHMAISSDGRWDETYIRQAVEHVMRSCLPAADWAAESERTIIREIIAKVILGNIIHKIIQPWFIHKVILDLLSPTHSTHSPQPKPPEPIARPSPHKPFTLQTLVVFFLSAVQIISGFCLAAIAFSQKALHTFRSINRSSTEFTDARTNLSRPLIDMMVEILTMRSRAASASVVSLLQLCTGFSRSFFDRALPHVLYQYIITKPRITKMVMQGKMTLFPDGYPGPTPIDPTPEEQIILRERLELRLSTLMPSFPASLVLGPDPASRRRTISNAIEPFSLPECNAHLLIMLFDAILLTIFPEMGIQRAEGSSNYTEENETNSLEN